MVEYIELFGRELHLGLIEFVLLIIAIVLVATILSKWDYVIFFKERLKITVLVMVIVIATVFALDIYIFISG